ncbi:MAG: signal peptidase I [Chloroflexota bacterium]|nr:signal peptidase I [Chloroflexota bacterium]
MGGILLGSVVAAAYFIVNLVFPRLLGGFIGTYVAQPILWSLLAGAVLLLPRYRPAARLRLRNLLITSAFLVAGFQISLSLIAGIVQGFGESPYSFTPRGIVINLIFVSSSLLGIELSRAWLVNRFGRKHTTLILGLVTLLYTAIMVPPARFTGLGEPKNLVRFLSSMGLPLLAENLLASFLAFLAGPPASMTYRGTLQAFEWFCPILPDLSDGIKALVGTIAPVIGFLVVQSLYSSPAERRARGRPEEEGSLAGWIIVTIVGVLIIWFSLGLFSVFPTVVYSGSMMPVMDVGDMAIVAETPPQKIRQGDIVQYYYPQEEIMVIHRVVDISKAGASTWFTTKGDASADPDAAPVHPSQIVGKVILVLPKVGWASIGIKSLVFQQTIH